MPIDEVTIRMMRVLRGPNLYAYMPVLQIVMDIGPYEYLPSSEFPGIVERLTDWLPGLRKHECGLGRPGGFIERLERGTYLAHIVEHITLELQGVLGSDTAFGRARGTGEQGVYNVVIAYEEEELVKAAFQTALRLTIAAMHDEPFDLDAELEALRLVADEYRLGPSTAAIVKAARARRIPVLRLTPKSALVQLGYGFRQRRILASETSHTSAIAVDLCQEKPLTNRMLRAVGVPVPAGGIARTAQEAWDIAQEVGLPVVIKPSEGQQGKGVSVNLTTETDVRDAFHIALEQDRGDVLVERFIQGSDHRLLVINGKLVAAARREVPQVIGDGQHSIEDLVESVNHDPRRRPGHSSSLSRIVMNDAVDLTLAQQGLTRTSVPDAGQVVRLRTNSNLSTGGTAIDVTDDVHPRNARLAELAAQILALDVAGVDILCHDISRPLAEQDGAIVEVNAAPGLRMHLSPAEGQPRDVGQPIVEMLYPDDSTARIPLIAVTGTNGKTTVTRLIAHMFETAHKVVGMTCTDGIYINGELVKKGDCAGPKSAQTVLLHPYVEVAVLETARGGILREGLAFDECLVGVVTNVTADHLGLDGIDTLEEIAEVKQVVVEAVTREGAAVLNADDPLVAEMAAATDARVVYFSQDPNNHIIHAHLADNGWCVFVENNAVVLATGEAQVELIELDRVPFTMEGKIGFQVMNALAAVGAAWAAGLNPALIGRALTTFQSDVHMVPGRFNVQEINGIELLFDYGHNTAALQALGEAVRAMDRRHTIMALTLPGDRRDEDVIASTQATVPYVDAYVLYDSLDLRGRAIDEIPHMMRSVLPDNVTYQLARGQREGILKGWQMARPGDRLIVIVDDVDEALEILQEIAAGTVKDAECASPLVSEVSVVRLPETLSFPALGGKRGES